MQVKAKSTKIDLILTITALVLLLSAVVLFVVVELTHAAESDGTPRDVLNYETGRLYWNHASDRVDENGVYQLSLFDSLPKDESGESMLAPGDSAKSIIELRNKAGHAIQYTAILYKISEADVPIETDFTNIPIVNNASQFRAPEGVKSEEIIRAVEGSIDAFATEEIDVEWFWSFSEGEEQDAIDTALGNLEYADVKVGVHVTVIDDFTPTATPDEINKDIDGDGIPDINLDIDGDGEPEQNLDIDGDDVPDMNIDTNGDGITDINIDIDGKGLYDGSIDTNDDGIADKDVIEFTIEDGVIIFTPLGFSNVLEFADTEDGLTLRLDNIIGDAKGVDIPKDTLEKFVETGGDIEIIMTTIEVTVDNEALQSIIENAAGANIRLIVKFIQWDDLNHAQRFHVDYYWQVAAAIRAYVVSGDTVIEDFGEGSFDISVPYELYEGTVKEDYKLNEAKENGEYIDTNAEYDDGFFKFSTSNPADYLLIYYGEVMIGGISPEPPECTCWICLFGGECRLCWVCWLFVIIVALVILIILLKSTGLLNVIYGRYRR